MPLIIALWRAAQRVASAVWLRVVLVPALLLAWLDRRPTVRTKSTIGEGALGPKIAVFCHFDRAGRIRDDLKHYLAELVRCGFSIVFVSNAPFLLPAEMAFLQRYCAGLIMRRNVGFDFAAWKDALAAYGLPRPETTGLLLANDSNYGPIRPLWPVLAEADFSRADLWALTDSWQLRYHLQSYFLLVGPRVFTSSAWATFWAAVRPLASKYWVVRHFEVGFSQAMLRAGFRLRAIWPYAGLLDEVERAPAIRSEDGRDPLRAGRERHRRRLLEAIVRGQPLNPTHELWRELLSDGYPFLKREMLRENRARISDLWEWRALVAESSEVDPEIIVADLARSARNRAP